MKEVQIRIKATVPSASATEGWIENVLKPQIAQAGVTAKITWEFSDDGGQ